MAKPYRIKHKASGLYYQPARNHSNLGKNGKVYMANNSPLLANTKKIAKHLVIRFARNMNFKL